MPSEEKQLMKEISTLRTSIEKQNSFKRSFLLAIVGGVGYSIGASIVAGIVIAILAYTLQSVEDVPVLNKFIQQEEQLSK